MQQGNSIYKNYHQKSSKSLDYEIVQSGIENVSNIISQRKSGYYSMLVQKLTDPSTIYKIH